MLATFIKAAETAEVVTEDLAKHFTFLDAPPIWVLVLVVLPTVIGLAWLTYNKSNLSPAKRFSLGILRATAVLFVLALIFRPAQVEERRQVRPAKVLLMIDDSASMARTDAWSKLSPNAEAANTRTALAKATQADPSATTRSRLSRIVLDTKIIPTLEQRGYEVEPITFAEGWSVLAGAPLQAAGSATHLGDAIIGALGAHSTDHVTAAVILTDGRITGGTPLVDASRRAMAQGVPLFTLTAGDPAQEAGLVIELVEAPDSVMAGDEIAAMINVIGHGNDGRQTQTTPRLEELQEPGDQNGRILDESEIELTEAGLRLSLVAPAELGSTETMRHFLITAPALDGEVRVDDNQVRFSVRVTTEPIRVLYVDGYPRWEYRFLKEFLKRGDANITVRCFLGSAATDFPQEASRDLEPLRGLPQTTKDLLDNFDVVILGDINPRRIAGSEAQSLAFAEALVGFVEAGGGVAMQAGELDNPRSFTGTPLEVLLPVKLDPAGRAGFAAADKPFHPVLEHPTTPHEITRIDGDVEVNRALFEDEEGLAGFYWFFPVDRAKAGSEVLLSHPFEDNRYGRRPLLVTGHHPAGRTLFLAVDSTWRWNWRYGPTYRQRFWKGMLRWLALGRLKSGDRRFRVEPVRSRFGLDERVSIGARVLDEDWEGSEAPELEVKWSGPDGESRRATLTLETGRAGNYSGSLPVERPGDHRVWIESEGVERTSSGFEVTLPSKENADPSPDPEAMLELSRSTGGLAFALGQVDQLLEAFPGGEERHEPIEARLVDLWDNPFSLLFLLGILSAEWILRKREDMP